MPHNFHDWSDLVLHSLTAIVNLSGLHEASRRIGVLAGAVRWRNLASQKQKEELRSSWSGELDCRLFPAEPHPSSTFRRYIHERICSNCSGKKYSPEYNSLRPHRGQRSCCSVSCRGQRRSRNLFASSSESFILCPPLHFLKFYWHQLGRCRYKVKPVMRWISLSLVT
mgnify:CR=1 FL=1